MGKTVSVSRVSAKCRDCPRVDQCDRKRMEAMACILPDDLDRMNMDVPSVGFAVPEPAGAVAAFHDMKFAGGVDAAIELNEIGKKMAENFYRGIGLCIDKAKSL